MAARLVSSIMTSLQLRGCCSRYFLTVFLDSPTLMARRMRPLPASSWPILSTKAASSAQKPHQVVQNSRRTTLPLMVSLENFSPVVVVALKRGAGSLSFGPARAQTAARTRTERIAARNEMFFAAMLEMYTVGGSTCQLLCWQVSSNQQESRIHTIENESGQGEKGAGSILLLVPPLTEGMAAAIFVERDEEDAVEFGMEAGRNNNKGSPPAGDSLVRGNREDLTSKLNVLLGLGDVGPVFEDGLPPAHGFEKRGDLIGAVFREEVGCGLRVAALPCVAVGIQPRCECMFRHALALAPGADFRSESRTGKSTVNGKVAAIERDSEGDDDGSRQLSGCGAIDGERSGAPDHDGQADDKGQDVVFVAFAFLHTSPISKETEMPVDEDDGDHHVGGDAESGHAAEESDQ